MRRRKRVSFAKLMATTSIVALSLAVAPVALHPDFGGATLSYADSGSSCFVAGTTVMMADGSERPIDEVRPGEMVRGGRGGINRVIGVEAPRLGKRRLYAFNGGNPFVTAEHPFLTMAGWKAIDPIATARENAALKVAELAVGDLLTRAREASRLNSADNLARDVEVEFWLDALQELNSVAADPETTVYNLFLDGDHSYIANGFVVHNKGDDDGGEGGDDGGDDGGGEGGDDGGDEGGDDSGGEGGDDGGDEGGDDGGDDGGEGGDDDGDDGGESGDDDEESGESGSSGESGDDDDDEDSGEGGEINRFSGDPGEADRDLTQEEEAGLIERGWQ